LDCNASCGFEIIPAFLRCEEVADLSKGTPQIVIGSGFAFRNRALSLAKAFSMGFMSGEYLGKNSTHASRSLTVAMALWVL